MKKVICAILAAMALVLCSALPSSAWVRGRARPVGGSHGHFHSGVFIGVPFWGGPGWWGPGWWGPAYPYPYYADPPVVVQQAPPVYVQPEPQPQSQQPYYWYYCQNPQGYYPYVQQCPGGWMTVVPPTAPPGR